MARGGSSSMRRSFMAGSGKREQRDPRKLRVYQQWQGNEVSVRVRAHVASGLLLARGRTGVYTRFQPGCMQPACGPRTQTRMSCA